MRAKTINEIDNSLFKPKELSEDLKIVIDVQKELEQLYIKTDLNTYGFKIGQLNLSVYNNNFRSYKFYNSIDIIYRDKEKWNKHVSELEDPGKPIDYNTWYINDYNKKILNKYKTWNEAKKDLLNILHPDLREDIENNNESINKLEKELKERKFFKNSLNKIEKILNE